MKDSRYLSITGLMAVLVVLLFGCPNSASDIPVTGVSLNKDTISIAVGGTEQLTATVARRM